MREDILEQLSSFMDGELSGRDSQGLVEACANDDGLREKWARYHLIGTTLRSGLPARLPRDLPDRVTRAMCGEPAIRVAAKRRLRFAPAFGLAMAASAAGLLFFQLGDWSPSATSPGATSSSVSGAELHANDAAQGAHEGRQHLAADIPYATVLWAGERHDTPKALTTYILMHNQYDGSLGGPEVSAPQSSPYFTTVVHEPSP